MIALHVSNRDFVPAHTAPFSIKYVFDGTESYYIGNKKLTVDASKYVILNKGESYASKIDSSDPTHSVCIFFSEHFLRDGFSYMTQSKGKLLDNSATVAGEVNFYQKLYWKDVAMEGLLMRLRNSLYSDHQDLEINEWCSELLEHLFNVHHQEQCRYHNLSALKRSTKEELYRRLSVAVDFLHEHFRLPVTLGQLSEVACLSQFYFLRAFRQAFKMTPHQYLTSLRLRYACHLLKTTLDPVGDICFACGFSDESSFARLFKGHHGVTPTAYRSVVRST
jgi:AraC-like DNA-binding protein